MGKKSKLKKIRRIASAMPVIEQPVIVRDCIVSGAELKKQGVLKVGGRDVNEAKEYIKKKVEQVPVNHNRKMKQLYNSHGVAGVQAYIQAVQRWVALKKTASK